MFISSHIFSIYLLYTHARVKKIKFHTPLQKSRIANTLALLRLHLGTGKFLN